MEKNGETCMGCNSQSKVNPLQAWRDPDVSRRLRFPDLNITIGT
jgi:hypothetical protein